MLIEMEIGRVMIVSTSSLMAVIYIGIFPSLISYFLFNRGTEIVGPSHGGLFMHLLPVWTVVLSVLFLEESLALYHAVGIAFVALGMYIVFRKP